MSDQRVRMSREDRSRQILDSARSTFIEKGYKGATTAEIAKAANIAEVTLFRYFDSKKDLFLKCIIPVLTETLEESLYTNEGDSLNRLKSFLTERISLVVENRDVVKLVLMENQVNEDFKEIDFIETIGQIIISGIKDLGFNSNEEFLKRMIMGSILSFLYLPSEKEEISIFVDGFINLMKLD